MIWSDVSRDIYIQKATHYHPNIPQLCKIALSKPLVQLPTHPENVCGVRFTLRHCLRLVLSTAVCTGPSSPSKCPSSGVFKDISCVLPVTKSRFLRLLGTCCPQESVSNHTLSPLLWPWEERWQCHTALSARCCALWRNSPVPGPLCGSSVLWLWTLCMCLCDYILSVSSLSCVRGCCQASLGYRCEFFKKEKKTEQRKHIPGIALTTLLWQLPSHSPPAPLCSHPFPHVLASLEPFPGLLCILFFSSRLLVQSFSNPLHPFCLPQKGLPSPPPQPSPRDPCVCTLPVLQLLFHSS